MLFWLCQRMSANPQLQCTSCKLTGSSALVVLYFVAIYHMMCQSCMMLWCLCIFLYTLAHQGPLVLVACKSLQLYFITSGFVMTFEGIYHAFHAVGIITHKTHCFYVSVCFISPNLAFMQWWRNSWVFFFTTMPVISISIPSSRPWSDHTAGYPLSSLGLSPL